MNVKFNLQQGFGSIALYKNAKDKNELIEIMATIRKYLSTTSTRTNSKLVTYLIKNENFVLLDAEHKWDYVASFNILTNNLNIEDKNYRSLFNGNIAYVTEYSVKFPDETEEKLKSAIGKVIRFDYNGGSNYGGTRVVKVKSYDNGKILGSDLVQDGVRTYYKEKISNLTIVS